MTKLEDMCKEELLELLGDEDIDALLRAKSNELSRLTTPELTELPEDADGLYDDDEFTKILEDRQAYSKLNEVEQEAVRRWSEIEALRGHYILFSDFLYDCMTELMGFQCSELQIDIADFLQFGQYDTVEERDKIIHGMLKATDNMMIQAQRSQAKSTIVAMCAVWQLIMDCKHRVLIISAGSEVAAEIANWVIQIIMNWDILECMRPDRQHGDRASTKAFDIHWQLKGPEKSPSVACIGITANMQGRRADLLIPDDIESSKNGTTEVQRAALEHLSRDFPSICQKGRIVYLGTPQTVDSIYNQLPERGFLIRVWTGRFPTIEEERHYGDTLAPYIVNKMYHDATLREGGGLEGNRGKPTDPVLLDEAALCKKEMDQGQAYFNLQHMLNTELSDELRHPLKTKNLIMMPFPNEKAPGEITWLPSPDKKIEVMGFSSKPQFYRPYTMSTTLYEFEGKNMYVDTAGGGENGDETVAAITYFLHGYIFLAEIIKLKGGYSDENYKILSEAAMRHNVNYIDVEKNFGFGAFASSWRPILLKTYKEAGKDNCPRVEDVWESGQKELRIIDTLEPIIGRHRLIVHTDIIQYDLDSVKKYPIDQQESYKFFHQLAKISRERGCLIHDDSIDAVAGACRRWVDRLAIDEQIRMQQKETDENVEFMASWGADIGKQTTGLGLMSDRFKRRQTKRPQRKQSMKRYNRR